MTTLERLEGWRKSGAIREEQFQAISMLVRKERFSVYLELNVLLYLGVLFFVAGAGWTVQKYFSNLGDFAIIASLTVLVGICFYYCLSRTKPWSKEQVDSPNLGFDYVLYLACLLFGVELGYLETRFQLLDFQWDYYLLISTLLFFACAYRFDNRFVLSLALSTLATWFGIRFSRFDFPEFSAIRASGISFAVIAIVTGVSLHRAGVKKHFLETYLHIATNVLLAALASGVQTKLRWYLPIALAACTITFWCGLRFRKFAFLAYGIIYGYIVVSIRILQWRMSDTQVLTYFIISGTVVLLGMILLARRIGRVA
jgi:hypothetical protein